VAFRATPSRRPSSARPGSRLRAWPPRHPLDKFAPRQMVDVPLPTTDGRHLVLPIPPNRIMTIGYLITTKPQPLLSR